MTNKKSDGEGHRRIHSIHFELALTVAISAIAAFAVAVSVLLLGSKYVSYILRDQTKRAELHSQKLEEFADYVNKNNVSSEDGDAINEWLTSQDDDVSVTIYRTDYKLLHDYGGYYRYEYNANEKPPVDNGEKKTGYDSTVYPVKFSDGVYSLSVSVSTRAKYYRWLIFFSFFVYFVLLICFLMVYSRYTIKKLRSLSKQTFIISRGDINKKVVLKCNNELSMLADDIDTMRVSLVERIEGEKKAWEANKELITSISHDIRNPLTTMVAYSEILSNGQYESEEQMKQYITVCRDKSYQLKKLTDELFAYFLVFGESELKPELTTENAAILLGQVVGEPIAELRIKGCAVKDKLLSRDCGNICIDVMFLKRIMDNIFSNINKYADLEKAITVNIHVSGNVIYAEFKNYIKEISEPTESSKIGLKSCERLCASMGIVFRYYKDNDIFAVELAIPLVEE